MGKPRMPDDLTIENRNRRLRVYAILGLQKRAYRSIETPLDLRMEITPGMAKALYDEFKAAEQLVGHPLNRRHRELTALRYGEDLAANRWLPSCDSIGITWDGVVFNGQHRLLMSIAQNKPIPQALVSLDMPPETVEITDVGGVRKDYENLHAIGKHGWAGKLESSAAAFFAMSPGQKNPMGSRKASVHEKDVALTDFGAGIQFAVEVLGTCKDHGIGTAPVVAAIAKAYYHTPPDQRQRLADFAKILTTAGTGMTLAPEDGAALALGKFLRSQAKGIHCGSHRQDVHLRTQWAIKQFLARAVRGFIRAPVDEPYPVADAEELFD